MTINRFWVLGGEYTSIRFEELVDGTERLFGPFAARGEAERGAGLGFRRGETVRDRPLLRMRRNRLAAQIGSREREVHADTRDASCSASSVPGSSSPGRSAPSIRWKVRST